MPLPIPKFIKTAFANIGLRNNIPETTNNTTGAAGYDRGFGEINMLPEGAGGIPPDGKDFNGIFFDISSAIRYLQSGVEFPFNQDFANAIGGYEIGAIVSDSSNKSLLWINVTASNTAFPTGWTSFQYSGPTETVRGMPLVATAAEVKAGLDGAKMLTPLLMANAFGVGQSIVDVTGSRSAGIFYTNTTGRPILVSVSAQVNAANAAYIVIRIDGHDSSVSRSPVAPGGIAVNAVAPPGSSYSVSVTSATITKWTEFR